MADKKTTFSIQTIQALLCTALISSSTYCKCAFFLTSNIIVVTLANYSLDKVVYYDELLFTF